MRTAIGECAIGIQLASREAILFHDSNAAVVLHQARRAEELGFASVWVGDSLTARPRFDPLTLLAGVAAMTNRVHVGTAILLPALRHPVLVAHQLATIDRLSAGRLVVGVGAGAGIPATEAELDLVGVAVRERVGRTYAAVRVWRALWRGDPVPKTKYWTLDDLQLEPTPSQPLGPPVWLVGEAAQTLARAGEFFDGWLPFSPNPEVFGAGWQAVRHSAERANRAEAVAAALYATVTINADAKAAEAEQAEHIEAYYGAPYDFMREFQCCIAGDAEHVTAALRDYVDAGATHLVLRAGTPNNLDGQLEAIADALLHP